MLEYFQVMICDKSHPVHIVARVDFEHYRSVEFLILSYKCREKILDGRIDQLQRWDGVDDFMKQVFERLGNDGLPYIAQKSKIQQDDKNTYSRHMPANEFLQKLLKQVIGEIEEDVYDVGGDADRSHI